MNQRSRAASMRPSHPMGTMPMCCVRLNLHLAVRLAERYTAVAAHESCLRISTRRNVSPSSTMRSGGSAAPRARKVAGLGRAAAAWEPADVPETISAALDIRAAPAWFGSVITIRCKAIDQDGGTA